MKDITIYFQIPLYGSEHGHNGINISCTVVIYNNDAKEAVNEIKRNHPTAFNFSCYAPLNHLK